MQPFILVKRHNIIPDKARILIAIAAIQRIEPVDPGVVRLVYTSKIDVELDADFDSVLKALGDGVGYKDLT